MKLLIFAVVNVIAAALSGAAGGGASLIGVPVLVMFGLSPVTAIATLTFNSVGLATGGSLRFYREKLVNRRTVIVFALVGAVGGAIGSIFLVRIGSAHQALLQQITGWIILLIGIPLLYVRNLGIEPQARARGVRSLGYVLMLLAAACTTAFSSGMGAIQTILLISCFGMTALTASATRRAVQLFTGLVSLTILVIAGAPNYSFGLVGLPTALLGSFIGAHIAVKKGNKFVINLFAITSAILAIQLLWP